MPTALVALGMAVVIGTKGIDLSVGSVIAIVGAVITWRIHAGDPHFVVLLIALGAGCCAACGTACWSPMLDIQPIIATLILMVSGPRHRADDQPALRRHQSELHQPAAAGPQRRPYRPDPDAPDLVAAIFVVLWALVRRTAFGLFLEAVGGNSAAARTCRRRRAPDQIRRLSHFRLLRRLAGVILTADTHTSDPVSVGLYIELDAILAVVIGGGSLSGGRIYLGRRCSARWSSRR